MKFFEDADELDKVFEAPLVLMPLGMLREVLVGYPHESGGARFLRTYWDMPEDTLVEIENNELRIWRVQ